ncbi:GtrA family protein [Microvirga sp. VF16]|uniref:GtrA family protein n=1 Tax=Microvirga sp. VF16 TaxID=2807101 RepID=UPI00193D2111|nr:GtrA family protein [Microvirga sp. VF16]QRM28276.1 GtrA family protein [Microvirga sp. VF16]
MNDNQTAPSEAPSTKAVPAKGVFAKLIRFALAGAISTALYFLIATLAVRHIDVSPVTASCLAYVICIVVSYFLQSRFTFSIRNDTAVQIMKFLSVSFVGLLVAALVMHWAVHISGLPYWIGAAVVSGVIPIANFVVFLIWVFVER